MKLNDFTNALESKYLNTSTSAKILNESIDWDNEYSDQIGEFIFKQWPNGFNAQIYLPNEEYTTYHVNLCKDFDDYLAEYSKDFDSLEDAKKYASEVYDSLAGTDSHNIDEDLSDIYNYQQINNQIEDSAKKYNSNIESVDNFAYEEDYYGDMVHYFDIHINGVRIPCAVTDDEIDEYGMDKAIATAIWRDMANFDTDEDLNEDFWNPGKEFEEFIQLLDTEFDNSEWNNWNQAARDAFAEQVARRYLEINPTPTPMFFQDLTDNNFHTERRAFGKLLDTNDKSHKLNESSCTRFADTGDQEKTIKKIEQVAKRSGINLSPGTKVGKYPQTVILDNKYQDGLVRVHSNGSFIINGKKFGNWKDEYFDVDSIPTKDIKVSFK